MNDYEFMREDMQSDVRSLGGQARARRCLNFSIFSIREPAGVLCSRLHMRRDHGATDRQPPPKLFGRNRRSFHQPAGVDFERRQGWVQKRSKSIGSK